MCVCCSRGGGAQEGRKLEQGESICMGQCKTRSWSKPFPSSFFSCLFEKVIKDKMFER